MRKIIKILIALDILIVFIGICLLFFYVKPQEAKDSESWAAIILFFPLTAFGIVTTILAILGFSSTVKESIKPQSRQKIGLFDLLVRFLMLIILPILAIIYVSSGGYGNFVRAATYIALALGIIASVNIVYKNFKK